MKRRLTVEIVSSLFILLFVYAAASKLMDVQKFQVQLRQSPLLVEFAPVITWLIPILEIAISISLATNRLRLPALYAAFTLMVLFTTYIVIVTNFSAYVPCSCGGILEKLNWNDHLLFNVLFIALGIFGILLYQDSRTLIKS